MRVLLCSEWELAEEAGVQAVETFEVVLFDGQGDQWRQSCLVACIDDLSAEGGEFAVGNGEQVLVVCTGCDLLVESVIFLGELEGAEVLSIDDVDLVGPGKQEREIFGVIINELSHDCNVINGGGGEDLALVLPKHVELCSADRL